jgi:hypothetical protein
VCIVCGNCVDLFKYNLLIFIFVTRSSGLVSKLFIDGICVLALSPATKTTSGATVHSLVVMLLIRCWYFAVFISRVFCGKSIIIVCNFYELYCEFMCKAFWWWVSCMDSL